MLTIKKLFIFFPKNFPNKHETTRFRKGKNKGNKYIEKKKITNSLMKLKNADP
jgi:hypothetical protein